MVRNHFNDTNFNKGRRGDRGFNGQNGFNILLSGRVSSVNNLPTNPNKGEAFLIEDINQLWFWDGSVWAGKQSVGGLIYQGNFNQSYTFPEIVNTGNYWFCNQDNTLLNGITYNNGDIALVLDNGLSTPMYKITNQSGFNFTGTQNGEYLSWDNTNSQWVVEGSDRVKIGRDCGLENQASKSVAIGYEAGKSNQGNSVAIGEGAGGTDQGSASVSIGRFAGDYQAGVGSISIGLNAGNFQSGNYSISIGSDAGYSNMGAGSIGIGEYAGYHNQSPNSIILNATGNVLNGANSGFYVKPVRSG